MPSLDNLNPKQREAASQIKGPVLVLAGAGSGKTRTLTYRIANLIENNIRPTDILAVTFTNKASIEMRERVNQLISNGSPLQQSPSWMAQRPRNFPLIGTFHFFCLTVLREDFEKVGLAKNFAVLDSNDQLSLIKKIIKNLGLSPERVSPKTVQAKISSLKNELITPQEFIRETENYLDEKTADIYRNYQKELLAGNTVDFDDIIMYTVKIWKENENILEKYRDRYPYVLVDEYQDTNEAQYQLIKLLAARERNLFVVGDDYQSIYAWRGANIKNILDFERDYPEAKIILLEQNYRSTQNILTAAQNIIDKNPRQKLKQLWTENAPGPLIVDREVANEEEEARFIVEEISDLAGHSGAYSDFAVLYRINSQSRAIEEQFIKQNVPYKIVGGIKFYERAEVKDMLAYLRLVANLDDSLALERVINVPRRFIGKKTLEKLTALSQKQHKNFMEIIEDAKKNPDDCPLPKAKLKQLTNFANLIKKARHKSQSLTLKDLIAFILKESGYENHLLDEGEEGKTRLENVMELLSVADKYKKLKATESLADFLAEASLATSEENPNRETDVVTLMTLHSAKGLEFKHVFIPGVEEGLLPHSRSLESPKEMEEERRLCYVGITRAKQRLWLIHARNRRIFGQLISGAPSRFLDDIPDKFLKKQVSPPQENEYFDYPETDSDFYDNQSITWK
ncbi:MAG: UvrD-helicase domain-containing protein [Patescibacteria group bacterium]|nr:UvrD-helicase domain-containing protein [Patescibacteria group bacterium]